METIGIKDNSKARASNPQFPIQRNQSQYLGKVVERFEDNVDDTEDKPRDYRIKFDILGLDPFTGEWPIANPLGNSTRPVEVDAIVKLWDVCDINTGLHTFYYEPIFEDRFTGIKNYDNEINLTEKNVSHIKLPNCEITLDRHDGSNGEKDQDDLDDSKGSVTIKLPGCEVVYSNDDELITTNVTFDEELTVTKTVKRTYEGTVEETYKDTLDITSESTIKTTASDNIEYKSDADIKLDGSNLNFKASTDIAMESTNAEIKTNAGIKLTASATIDIKSTATMNIEAGAPLTIKGTGNTTIESTGPMTVKGMGMTTIESTGPLMLKGLGSIITNAIPAGPAFCALPVCVMTGAPHTTPAIPSA